jgi:hypothetical protein
MMQPRTTKYLYGKFSSTLSCSGLAVGIGYCSYVMLTDGFDWIWVFLHGLTAAAFLIILFYIVFKFLIPALQLKVALQFDEVCVTSYTENIIVHWEDIKEILFVEGRWTASLRLTLTDDEQYRISLRYVEGDNRRIFETFEAYFYNE